jgi:hypothetical protein
MDAMKEATMATTRVRGTWRARLARMAQRTTAAMALAGMAVALGGAVLAGSAAAQAVVTEERSVAGIAELELSGIGTLRLIQGDTESLFITAEEAVLPQLTSEVTNGRLVIAPLGSFSTSEPVTYELTVTDLSVIALHGNVELAGDAFQTAGLTVGVFGSSTMAIEELTASELAVVMDGSSALELAGQADLQQIEMGGSAAYQAEELQSVQTSITAGGTSAATLQVSETLQAAISGSAAVSYGGDPTGNAGITEAGTLEQIV